MVRLVIVVIALEGGLTVEARAFDRDQPLMRAPDLAVGGVLLAVGASVMERARHTGVLFIAVGVLWFAGTIIPGTAYWHRGVLVHLLVSYPDGRFGSRSR